MKACESGILSEDDTRNLAELSKIILGHITRKLDSDLRERMVALLGGQVLELRQDIWFRQGFEKGEKQGYELGEKSLLFSLVMDNELDVSVAAKRAGKDEATFIKEMKEYIAEQKNKSKS